MGKPSEPIQSAQPLRECAHTASLRDEVFRVDVGPYFQGLRRHHDQVMPARCIRRAARRHSVFRVKYSGTGQRRLAFARQPRQKQNFCIRECLAQAFERFARRSWRVAEHKACSRRGRPLNERFGGLCERFRRRSVDDIQVQRLRGVHSLANDRVPLIVVIQIEPLTLGSIPGRRQRDDRWPRAICTEQVPRRGIAGSKGRNQRSQVLREMRLVQQHQAIGAGHRGVYGRPTGSIASEQQAGSIHRKRAQDDRRPRWVGRCTRGNAAPEADHIQRRRSGIDPQRTKSLGNALDNVAPGGIQLR